VSGINRGLLETMCQGRFMAFRQNTFGINDCLLDTIYQESIVVYWMGSVSNKSWSFG
jgi:hypothetical protein